MDTGTVLLSRSAHFSFHLSKMSDNGFYDERQKRANDNNGTVERFETRLINVHAYIYNVYIYINIPPINVSLCNGRVREKKRGNT